MAIPQAVMGRRTALGFVGVPVEGNGTPSYVGPILWSRWLIGKDATALSATVELLIDYRFTVEFLIARGILHPIAGIRRLQPAHAHVFRHCALPSHCLWPVGSGYAPDLPVIPWAYVVDVEARTLLLLQSHLRGIWQWVLRCEAPLDGPEPEWATLEGSPPGDAAPWPYIRPDGGR